MNKWPNERMKEVTEKERQNTTKQMIGRLNEAVSGCANSFDD